jgi:hypothetical protein
MKVKAQIEKIDYLEAEVEVDDAKLLEYVNNGGQHNYETLDAARGALGEKDFLYILREYVEYEVVDDNPHLVGISTSPVSDSDLRVEKVEVV